MYRLLEFQANQIEMVLASHDVPSRVFGGLVTPRFVQFQLAPPLGIKVKRIASLSEEIALSLGARSCRVYRQGGTINVEVPRKEARTVKLIPLCRRLSQIPPCTAVLGLDESGTPLLLHLPSPDVAHVLIAGTTGSGKTELLRTMIASLVMHNRLGEVQLVLVDPKGRGFAPFVGLPHLLHPLVNDAEETLSLLRRLVEEMERRDQEGISEPKVMVFVDELADLMLVGGREMERVLTRLLQRGREAGVHLVGCTQKPTAAVIGSLVKSNFPVRLVGSVTSPEDAKVAAGIAGTGAEKLLGRGDFLVVVKGQVLRLQAAYVSVSEIREMVTRLREGGRRSRRWLEKTTGIEGKTELSLKARLASRLRLVKAGSR